MSRVEEALARARRQSEQSAAAAIPAIPAGVVPSDTSVWYDENPTPALEPDTPAPTQPVTTSPAQASPLTSPLTAQPLTVASTQAQPATTVSPAQAPPLTVAVPQTQSVATSPAQAQSVTAAPATVAPSRSAIAYDNGGSLEYLSISEKLVVGRTVNAGTVEEFRRLAARLYLSQAEQGTRMVMVASALAGEGKTLTAANLALTLSHSYKRRVLLVDGDLRRPSAHEVFQVPNVSGLNDGIRSEVERKVPLIRISEHLSLLTAGRPDADPMSVLSSERMRRVLDEAREKFDWVIIDTPPLRYLTDANLLASLVDVAVLVVQAGRTPATAVQQAVDAIGRDRIAGVVLNRVSRDQTHADYADYAYSVVQQM